MDEFLYMPHVENPTYPDEDALWHAAHPPVSQKYMDNSTETKFEIIREAFEKEYSQFKDFLDGKLNMKAESYFTWFYNRLFYIEFPEHFERDIAGIYEELSSTDKAWVDNTRKLIQKNHQIVVEQQSKIWPQAFEQNHITPARMSGEF